MDLLSAFDISRGEVVSVVGSGGKTTLITELAHQLTRKGLKVLSTSTTHAQKPTSYQTEKWLIAEEETDLLAAIQKHFKSYHHITVLGQYIRKDKLKGLDPALVCKLNSYRLADVVLVHADGARKKSFKAPREDEPIIPACSTRCILVVGSDIIGKTLNEENVHRPEMVTHFTSLQMGETITTDTIVQIVNHPQTYFCKVPPGCPLILYLSKVGNPQRQQWAEEIRSKVDKTKIAKVVWGDLHLIPNSEP
ncbi:MAG TPA: selenium cofactor biosynthesis protein YqeC [Candidatus Limnocylindrales bacterium]|nr:selenium cofactor biosynthesis protein YqeC [Candidatus Limnocylindrales bacterium]